MKNYRTRIADNILKRKLEGKGAVLPSLDLIIVPYHHMNYLFYCNNEEVKENIKQVCKDSAFVNVV